MGQHDKASVVQAEREIKALKAENARLTKDLEETRSLYKQLVVEGPAECFDERRVHLLKSQVIQLERQLLLHSNALSSRSEVLLLVENSLQAIADQLRELLASEVKGPSVPIQRSQLTSLIETAEGARLRLFKNVEANDPERLSRPILYMGSFLKPIAEEDGVTLLDVCSGKLEHLNLKQIAKLESKLFSLHRHLQALHQSLKTTWSHDQHQPMQPTNQHLPLAANQRLSGLLAQCQKSVAESCSDLLSLSILLPSAPWPLIMKPVNPELSLDSVMAALPSFPKSKQQQGRACIDALLKACNYSRNVAKLEAKACAEELHFHQSVYDVQIKYMESLFSAVREAYAEFEQSTQTLLCQPLKRILEDFSVLTSTTSEEALRGFLTTFKAQANDLQTIVEILTVNKESPSSGLEALSTFGRDFFASVDAMVQQCSAERDRLAEEIEVVKKMKEEHLKNGLKVFERPKPGSGPKNAKEEYKEAIQGTGDGTDDVSGTNVETQPGAGTVRASNMGSAVTDRDGKTTTHSNSETSVTVRAGNSLSNRTVRKNSNGEQKRGPRVIGKLGSSKDRDGVLKKTDGSRPISVQRDTFSPVNRGVEGEGVSQPSPGPSHIPHSRSLSRLKPPSPKQSPVSIRPQEGSREASITKSSSRDGSLRQSLSGVSSVGRSASEKSRPEAKVSGAKAASHGTS